jgi:hypothetical protein
LARQKAQSRAEKAKNKAVAARVVRRQPRNTGAASIAAVRSDSSSILLPLVLGLGLGISLLVVALALTPPWALPRPVLALVYDRREAVIFWAFAIALTIGLATTFAAFDTAAASVAAVASDSSSILLPLGLGVGLGLLLLVAALALTPPWALPRPVAALVYDQREAVIFWAFAIALTIGLAVTFAAF